MAVKKKTVLPLKPKIFEHEQFGQIRFVTIDWEPWFVAVDVCRVLDIQNSRDVLAKQIPDDEKGVDGIYTPGGYQNMSIVSEPGLYRLIFMSRKPEAEKIKRWVFHEVLPSIRKYGYYVAPHQRIIEIVGDKNFKAFKAQYPEGTVEVKRILCDWEENECGEIRFFDRYEVVVHSDKISNALSSS